MSVCRCVGVGVSGSGSECECVCWCVCGLCCVCVGELLGCVCGVGLGRVEWGIIKIKIIFIIIS